MSFSEADHRFMNAALALGRRGLGKVWPRPSVGCVLVKDGRIVGRGHTQAEKWHGEVIALRQAGSAASGATAYVTLEPCAHHGRTPPCAEALRDAGIKRCVIAIKDPNALVNGKGIAILEAAGIQVEVGLCAEQARKDQAGFLLNNSMNRPFLTLKLAMSLDGRIATASGESRWITGPQARSVVHGLRANHDAVMVGGGTARADDPELTVRGMGEVHQPVRVVASRYLDLPLDSKLNKSAADIPVWLLHGQGAHSSKWAGTAAKLIEIPTQQGQQLSPAAMMSTLAKRGITRVFCEGGGSLAVSLLQAQVVDQLVVFHAGIAIGAEGTPGLGAMGLAKLAEAPRFQLTDVSAVGPDTMSVWNRTDS